MKKLLLIMVALLLGVNIQAQVVDPTTLNNKIMAGYQGWFGTANDGSGNGWVHYSRGGATPDADNITFDMWPDLREYDSDELFPTNFIYRDGSNAGLFSSYTPKTVDRHVKWMKDYGIDGVFVQRFISDVLSKRQQRDQVLDNVRIGAENHGRVFANMYDTSGANPATFVQDIKTDWMHLVDNLKITESPNYLHHDGLPVLSLWGVHVGNSGNDLSAADWLDLVTWFTVDAPVQYRVTLKAGVSNGWRTDNSSWQQVYDAFKFISPWAVGRYRDNNSADGYRNTYFQADLTETASRNMEYIPVVFPGFSWKNLKGEGNALNSIPRNGGDFLWHQFYNAMDAGCNMVYVAMFDEIDEGTAIFKTTENKQQTPVIGEFLTLDADGIDLPSDWYLRLTGEASKMLRGDIPLTAQIPISPYPNTSKFISQDVPSTIATGATVQVTITMQNTGTTTWTKAAGYKLASVFPEGNVTWGSNSIDLEDADAIAPGQSKTFAFNVTAPATENIYSFQWKMIQDGVDYFGQSTENRLINVGGASYMLDDCDTLTGWNSSTTLILNNIDKQEGDNSLQFTGSGDVEYRKVFSPAYNSSINEEDAVLQFWYFVSSATRMSSSNQVELGSGGTNDVDEYFWTLTGLQTGWNLISLKLRDAAKTGNPDLTAINWFRLYNVKSGTVRTRIDEIQILDYGTAAPKYSLTVNNGSGSGQYLEDSEIIVNLNTPPNGFKFNGWESNSGNVLILNPYVSSTTVFLFDEDSEITANYIVAGDYLDDCDAVAGWSGALSFNTNDNQEGLGCLEFTGLGTDEFNKQFSTPYNSNGNESNTTLSFWYYISDPSLVRANNQVEISSSGGADVDEYNWSLTGLTAGWNFIELNVADANKIGNPDLSAINWFRFYQFKRSAVTTRIDAIQLLGGSLSTGETESLYALKVFPNPTKNNINLLFNLNTQSNYEIQIYNTLGQKIYNVSQLGKLYPGSQNLEIKTNSLNTGIYFIKVTLEEQSIVKRIIKQ
jgi:hypothetical protein